VDEELCFIQFIHPGREHKPDDGLVKAWNRSEHKRKFLRQAGRYVSANEGVQEGEIVFWGEWEPESTARKIDNPIQRGPQYIFTPYYVVPKSYDGLQNTDPFVFGKHFHYTCCQQRTKPRLRHLSRGSMILFGSCEGRHAFVLDTVFVVDSSIDHTRGNHRTALTGAVSPEYEEVTICPMYSEAVTGTRSCTVESSSCTTVCLGSEKTWRLYFGATHDKPVQDMYSFFPCQLYDSMPRGFARPTIDLPGKITGALPKGVKYQQDLSLAEMKTLWQKVIEQVRTQGLALGVYAEIPERRLKDDSPTHGNAATEITGRMRGSIRK
jgi:hypothetical protein